MAQERFLPFLPQTRQVDLPRLIQDVEAPPLDLPAPTEEEARAVDQVFALPPANEHNTLMDGLTLAAAGMLFHDVMKDTLASPDEEEEDQPKAKPEEPDAEV